MRGATDTQSWTVWIEILIGLAVAVAVLSRGADGAASSLVFLFGAGAAAYSGFTIYRAVTALTDDRLPATAVGEDRRSALEYEKNLALAALKELEADAATGKVDRRDLPTLKATAEARALGLIRQIREEDEHWRREAEATVVGTASEPGTTPAQRTAAASAGDARRRSSPPASATLFDDRPVTFDGGRCRGCGFEDNPGSARFCASCGRPREAA